MTAWTTAEEDILRRAHADGVKWSQLGDVLPDRRPNLIADKARRMRLLPLTSTAEPKTEAPSGNVIRDRAFQRAMLRAIEAGEETVVVGVIVDNTPFAGLSVRGEPSLSLCGSTSQMCAEA